MSKHKRKPLYSLLCPSHGRPEMLENMLDSLRKTCTINERHVQILIKIDDDDPKAAGYYELVDKYKFRIKVLQASQRGYFDMGKAWNLMFEHVVSPIIWILNDDILVMGDWCLGLQQFSTISSGHYKDGIVIGSFQHRANFPIVRTGLCKKLGLISPSCGVDGFLTYIARVYRRLIVLEYSAKITHVFPPPTMFSERSVKYKPYTTPGYDIDLDDLVSAIKICDQFFVKTKPHRWLHRSYRTRRSDWPICIEARSRIQK